MYIVQPKQLKAALVNWALALSQNMDVLDRDKKSYLYMF